MPVGGFLAARRVLAASGGSRLVVVTTALSLGLVVYAGALADSTTRTIDVKASVASGSDVVVTLQRGSTADGELPPGTMAVGLQRAVHIVPGDTSAAMLAVHPEQVAGIVRWNDSLADQPLDQLMAALSDYAGDRVPVILAGSLDDSLLEGTDGALTVDFVYYTVPVQVVGRTDAFPGQGSLGPMLIADWDSYADALRAANRDPGLVIQREIWARGEVTPVLGSLSAAGYAPAAVNGVHSAADFAARPELNAQTWSLSYLRAVALAAGLLGLVGVAMHAVALQRRRTASTLLLRRMGMSRSAAQRSSGLAIGLLTGLGGLVAVAVALPTSALVLRLLDPVPTLRPATVFAVPWGTLAAVVAGVVLVTLVASMLIGRVARRATGGQVMRDAT
jgi:putative ABC transport system permease protein